MGEGEEQEGAGQSSGERRGLGDSSDHKSSCEIDLIVLDHPGLPSFLKEGLMAIKNTL